MKEKILLIALMAVLMVGLAEAAATVEGIPATSGTVGCSSNLSVSLAGTIENLTKAYFYTYSLDTPNSSYSNKPIATVDATNVDNNSQHLDVTLNTARVLMDGTGYYFKVIAGNSTNNYTDENTAINVDCTSPQCIDNSGFSSRTTMSPTASYSFTGGNATSGYIKFGGNTYPLTKGEFTGRNLALTFKGSNIPESVYSITATLTDGTNTIDCPTLEYVSIDDKEREGSLVIPTSALTPQQQAAAGVSPKMNLTILAILALVLIVAFNSKSKKKK